MLELSVLLPVYNAQDTLRSAIESILSQTFRDFEFLIIDDGSSDASVAVIQSYSDPRIRLNRNPENLKLIRTLNRGIELAKGRWIARMDADDIAFQDRLEKQLQFLRKNEDVVACGSNVVRIDMSGKPIGRSHMPHGSEFAKAAWLPSPIIHPTVVIRTDVARNNLFDPTSLHCEDYELWLRLRSQGYHLDNIKEPLLYYREHPASVSQQNRELQLENTFRIFKKYYPRVEISLGEFLSLIGANSDRSKALSIGRRIALVRELSAPGRISLRTLARHLYKHFKS